MKVNISSRVYLNNYTNRFQKLYQINGKKELKISSLLRGKKSIGRIFNLDMVRIINILYRLEKLGYVKVVRTAGLDIVEILTDMKYIDCIQLITIT